MLEAPLSFSRINNEIHVFFVSLALMLNTRTKPFMLMFVLFSHILSIEIPYFGKGLLCVPEL